jgi:LacI family gluconate utilization system Gnt-I transcriptional repressor
VAGDDERAQRRVEAFQATALALGLAEPRVVAVPAPTTLQSGRQALAQLLKGRKLDAVFCSSDLLALGVLTEARVRGVAVPEALAVVGFGDLEFAASLDPALTTVRINGAAIGRQAAAFIVERAEGRAVAQRVIDIGFAIVERDSA